jgi:hypothetical protein
MTTKTHTVPAGTMGQALLASGVAASLAYDYDLVDRIANLKHTELRNRVLSRLAFACDAYINISIQRTVSTLRADQELAGTATWDSYQAFLQYVAGIAASEETLTEAGMLVKPMRENVQKLYNVRTQIHDILLESIGASYQVPVITDWMANPRLRRDDATTLAKLKQSARFSATDMDTGVVDVDLEKQMVESIGIKRSAQKEDQLKWDKQRGELSAMLFNALKIRDDVVGFAVITMADQRSPELSATAEGSMYNEGKFIGKGIVETNVEPFLDLEIEMQFKLLTGSVRYIQDVVAIDLANDRKISVEEHAAAAIESRPLVKAIKLAMEHRRFKDVV